VASERDEIGETGSRGPFTILFSPHCFPALSYTHTPFTPTELKHPPPTRTHQPTSPCTKHPPAPPERAPAHPHTRTSTCPLVHAYSHTHSRTHTLIHAPPSGASTETPETVKERLETLQSRIVFANNWPPRTSEWNVLRTFPAAEGVGIRSGDPLGFHSLGFVQI